MKMVETRQISEKKMAVSGYRVLELLKALTKSPLTTLEMLQILEEKTENIYRKELVIKYLNTLKLIGFDIEKVKDKYVLKKGLRQVDFSYKDLSVLKFLEEYINEIGIEGLQKNFNGVFTILESSFSEETVERMKNSIVKPFQRKAINLEKGELVQKFEKYCRDELKLVLHYQKGKDSPVEKYRVIPIKIMYKKRKIVLIAFDSLNNEYKEFLLDCIVYSEQMPQKSIQQCASTVTFRLSGRLGKSYVLKTNEQLLEENKTSIVVSNNTEDKELLLRRLARYYDKCEILYPKAFRERFVEYLSAIEKVYESNV